MQETGTEGLVEIVSDIRPDLGFIRIAIEDFDPSKHTLYDPMPPTPELKPPPEEAIAEKPKTPRKVVKEVNQDAG